MKKARISGGFVVLLTVLCFFPSMGWATTWPVNCDQGFSIQTMINNNAQPGDTVQVSGTCNENVTVTLKGLTLDGQGTALIYPTDPTSPVVSVQAPNVTIKNFASIGGGGTAGTIGVQLSNSSSASIISNYIQDSGTHGVQVSESASALIKNNHILSNSSAGVLAAVSASASIVGNTIKYNQGTGITVRDNSSAHIGFIYDSDKNPAPNFIQSNGGDGVDVLRASCARLTGNTITGNSGNGVLVDRVSQADISGNTIDSNHQNGISVSGNSGVNRGAYTYKPESIFDDPNYTDTGSKNTGYAIVCANGGYVAGYLGSLAGSAKTPTSFSTNCVNALISTNTVVGNWTVASYAATTDEPLLLGSTVTFYSDGTGAYVDSSSAPQSMDWTLTGTKLTMNLDEGQLSGTIKWTDSDHATYTFTDSGYTTNPKTKFTLNLTRQQ